MHAKDKLNEVVEKRVRFNENNEVTISQSALMDLLHKAYVMGVDSHNDVNENIRKVRVLAGIPHKGNYT